MNRYQFIATALLMISCNDTTQKFDRQALDTKRHNIVSYINTASCSTPSGCRAIAFGAKGCGGPWEFFIYPTTLDTAKLIQLVDAYTQEEKSFNLKWKVISDCSLVTLPDSTRCVNGTCFGYWGGVARRQE